MMSARHLDDEVLSALVDGELDGPEAASALAHRESCPACRERMEQFGRVASLVGGTASAAVPPEPQWSIPSEPAWSIPGEPAWSGFDAGARHGFGRHGLGRHGSGRGRSGGRRAGRRPRWVARRGVASALSAAAVAAGVAAVLGLFGHGTPPGAGLPVRGQDPPAPTAGLTTSLGTFSDPAPLRAALTTEIASLAPGRSAAVLPCQEKVAGQVAPRFSSLLAYRGVNAQVFAFLRPLPGTGSGSAPAGHGRSGSAHPANAASTRPGARPPAKVAVVVRDGDCRVLARLEW